MKTQFTYYPVTIKLIITKRPASADRTARRQFQATGQPVSQTQASDALTSRLPRYEEKCVQCRCFECGLVPLRSDMKGMELPPANILTPLERQLIALQLCRCEFLYNETLQQTQYRRVTDGRTDTQTDRQTDGIAIASTALAMRALRRAVKKWYYLSAHWLCGDVLLSNITFLIFAVLVVWCSHCRPYKPFETVKFFKQ